MTARSSTRRSAAFTLVEVMIVMVLLALVVTAIYSTWIAIIKGASTAQRAAADVQRMRIAMQTLEQSFVGARLFAGNIDLYAFEVDSKSDYSGISFAAKLPRSFPRSGRYGDFDVRRVTFTVESSNGRQNELVVRQSPLLMEPDEDEEKFPLVLARDVSLFTVEFWDTNKFKWMDEWKWTNQLPRLVRISLGVGHAENRQSQPRELITRVVAIPSMAIPQLFQSPRMGGPGRAGQPPPPGTPPGQQPLPGTPPNNQPLPPGRGFQRTRP